MAPLIQFRNVSKTYHEKCVLTQGVTNLNFEINAGEIVSLIGPSGCGKTTILKMIGSLLIPTEGEILFQNENILFAKKRGLIGFVPQAPTLLPHRTVTENVTLPLEIKNTLNKEKVERAINSVNLTGFCNHYPHQLSGGMQQRVSLARAFVHEPQLLLMDEPFAALDEILREKLNLDLLKAHQEYQPTIIFVTHNLEEAVFISDKIIILTPQPGQVHAEININFPQPRTCALKLEDTFFNHVQKTRALLKNVC